MNHRVSEPLERLAPRELGGDVLEPAWGPLLRALDPWRARIIQHDCYRRLDSLASLRVFMAFHVFAVWNSMSLLKVLQRRLTCVDVPWAPVGDPLVRRLINEIVLAEESDEVGPHTYLSHFELYLQAMREAGARSRPIDRVLQLMARGASWHVALQASEIPVAARSFVQTTMGIIERGELHEVAAAFALGREDLIPANFQRRVSDLHGQHPAELSTFRYFLDRRIQLDGEPHARPALQMLAKLCGDDASKWRAAEEAARQSLAARLTLWDGVEDVLS